MSLPRWFLILTGVLTAIVLTVVACEWAQSLWPAVVASVAALATLVRLGFKYRQPGDDDDIDY